VQRLVEVVDLASGEIPPHADRDVLQRQGANSDATQAGHRDPDLLHQAADDVEHPLVDHNLEDQPVVGLAEDAALRGNNPLAVDHQAVAQALKGRFGRAGEGEHVVLLLQPVPRVHDAVGDVAVVGEQQQTFGLAVEASDRVDPLRNLDQLHHRLAVALVAHGRDIAAGLVEQQVARRLASEQLAVNVDLACLGIDLGAELGDDGAVNRHAPGHDQLFGPPAGAGAARGHHALEALHRRSSGG